MRIFNWLIPVVISLLAAILIWHFNLRTIGYVNLEQVFNSFQMKIELQDTFDKTMMRERKVLDSLNFEVAKYQAAWDENRTNAVLYENLSQLLESAGQRETIQQARMEQMKLEFDSQIQKQLAQYLNEFGQSVEADILFGIMDDGTVLYSSTGADMTSDAIQFINDRYLDK